MKEGFARLDADIRGLRGEMGELRGEMGELRGEMGEPRGEMNARFADIDSRFDNLNRNLLVVAGAIIAALIGLIGVSAF